MDHKCPVCNLNLRYKLFKMIAPGIKTDGVGRQLPVCPNCNTTLMRNNHAYEIYAGGAIILTSLVFVIFNKYFGLLEALIASGVYAVFILSLNIIVLRTRLKSWKRWVASSKNLY